MFRSVLSRWLSIAGLGIVVALAAGAQKVAAEDDPVIGLADSFATLSAQRSKSSKSATRQLGLVDNRLASTRGLRVQGNNINASSLAVRFSGGSAEKSASLETRHLLAPEKARRTQRAAVWFGGDVTLDDARAEDPHWAAIYTNGVAFGADARFSPRILVGNAVGAAFDKTGIGADGSLETRYLSNTLYGSFTTSRDTYLDIAIGASQSAFLNHYDGFEASPASRSANQFFGHARYSRKFEHGRLNIRSYGQAKLVRTRLGGYAEKGKGAHLYEPQSAESLEFMLGVRGERSAKTRVGRLSPHAGFEISRTLTRTSSTVVASADGAAEKDYLRAPLTTRSGRIAARTGLKWAITDQATLNGEYSVSSADAEFDSQQQVTAKFRLKF